VKPFSDPRIASGRQRPRRMTRLFPIALPVAMLALLACATNGSAAQDAESGDGLQVTVMIYSGRPDPTFTIDDEATFEELRGALSAAERADFEGETVIPSILGYKGVRVENRSGVAGLPAVFLVYDGAIEVRDRGRRFLADPDRRLERSLIQEATERDVFGDDERAPGIIREDLGGPSGPVS